MNTRGGRLDDGSGYLEDGSINCVINQADVLAKRKGFVRGIDEWFGSVVCGLFTYQDYCGNEYLLVATEDDINIRQPFQLPVETESDAYPSDNFDSEISESTWRNTVRYEVVGGAMVQVATAAAFSGVRLADDLFMRWFKDAGALAYLVELSYEFDPDLFAEQRVGIVIKGVGDLSEGALIQADVVFNPSSGLYTVQVFHRASDLTYRLIAEATLNGSLTEPSGSFSLRYDRDTSADVFSPFAVVLPNLGTLAGARGTLTQLEDADLGQVSALAIGQASGAVSQAISIPSVVGRPN